jgi:hypothetical protein
MAHSFRYFGDEIEAPPTPPTALSDEACQPGFDITVIIRDLRGYTALCVRQRSVVSTV